MNEANVRAAENVVRNSAGPNECIVILNLSHYEADVLNHVLSMAAERWDDIARGDAVTAESLRQRVADQLREDWLDEIP